MLVEDEDVDAFLSKRILQQMKITDQIIECKDGKEALRVLSSVDNQTDQLINEPELILLDINMPTMNGIEFLHELRETYENNSTVVILSSSENPYDISQFSKYQASYYLVKPITEEKVKKMLERCFE